MTVHETEEVEALYNGVKRILNTKDSLGRKVGDCQHGVYLFYDYEDEPTYVGQTRERLRIRIRRHLTNQRTDAVAMSVLDPFEVAEIEMWPIWEADGDIVETLNRTEFTVYQQALRDSTFGVILNESDIAEAKSMTFPPSVRGTILSSEYRKSREHPDVRLARRARTIANLARVISERKVQIGIRRTLWAQAQRLERLAKVRLDFLQGTNDD